MFFIPIIGPRFASGRFKIVLQAWEMMVYEKIFPYQVPQSHNRSFIRIIALVGR